jgi:hypothetical protein
MPALLVALGAGAALSSLVSVFPQVVWISEHKEEVFAVAGLAMLAAGVILWRTRTAPCPVDPQLRDACLKTRAMSMRVYWASVLFMGIGTWFAFIQPSLSA